MADVTETYYPSEGWIGYGSQLLVAIDNDPDTEATVAIAEVTTITPGSIDTEDVDRTHLRSPEAHHEHMPGLRDSAAFEIGGTLRLDHESQNNATPNGLIFLQRTRVVRNFAIKLADPAETLWPFRGYVSRFQIGALGITGLTTFTAGIMPTQSVQREPAGHDGRDRGDGRIAGQLHAFRIHRACRPRGAEHAHGDARHGVDDRAARDSRRRESRALDEFRVGVWRCDVGAPDGERATG